jgi:GntR family transcriptional regulator/MocR family aminotransferase
MRLSFTLDRRSPVPLHRQIYSQWREGILTGRFRSGEKVPSTREFSAALSIARTTVTAAYEQLVAEGYFESSQGAGTFVCHELPEQSFQAPKVQSGRRPAAALISLSWRGTRIDPVPVPAPEPGRIINLSQFTPDFEAFPFPIWRKLITRRLKKADMYRHAADAGGDWALRQEIASYVARWRAIHCTPQQIIVVNGSQQALDLCARLLLDPNDEVAVENPGYPGARDLFTSQGARLRPLSVTPLGISVSDLRVSTRMVFVTPSHQFPTGASMSVARRLELIAWARRNRAVLIEDDYDSEYRYAGAPLPAMQSLSNGGPVIYVGTFSNLMFPGLRIGYAVVPPYLVEAFTRAKWLVDRHTTILEQAALADFIAEGHLERHIRRMRRIYKRRREVLIDSLTKYFGSHVIMPGEPASIYLMVRFDSAAVIERARANGVHLRSSKYFYVRNAPENEFIIGFSAIGERIIREGIKRLAGA